MLQISKGPACPIRLLCMLTLFLAQNVTCARILHTAATQKASIVITLLQTTIFLVYHVIRVKLKLLFQNTIQKTYAIRRQWRILSNSLKTVECPIRSQHLISELVSRAPTKIRKYTKIKAQYHETEIGSNLQQITPGHNGKSYQ